MTPRFHRAVCECCRMTVRTGKAQKDQMFSDLPPKGLPDLRTNSRRQLFANAAIAASRVAS